MKEKQIYYKTVCEEYPGGLIGEDRQTALDSAKQCRSNGEKAYVRKIAMTEAEYKSLFEID